MTNLKTEPSQKVMQLCEIYLDNFQCPNCPIVETCFNTHGKDRHIEAVNKAAESLDSLDRLIVVE